MRKYVDRCGNYELSPMSPPAPRTILFSERFHAVGERVSHLGGTEWCSASVDSHTGGGERMNDNVQLERYPAIACAGRPQAGAGGSRRSADPQEWAVAPGLLSRGWPVSSSDRCAADAGGRENRRSELPDGTRPSNGSLTRSPPLLHDIAFVRNRGDQESFRILFHIPPDGVSHQYQIKYERMFGSGARRSPAC